MNKSVRFIFGLSLTILMTGCSGSISKLSVTGCSHFSDIQEVYLKSSNYEDTTPYNGNMSLSIPAATVLKWSGSNISKYKVNLYSDENLGHLEASYVTKKKELNFYNEKLNQKYYWNVTDMKGKVVSETSSFKNSIEVAGPRNLNVDGVENFRDIGGWGKMTENGYKRYMKQGMIYRSGRFNEDKAETVNVTVSEEGINELINNLKIKTEIDLRRSSTNEIGSLTKSVLGEDVKYVNLPMLYEGKNILTYVGKASGKDTYDYDNPKMIKDFFDILAEDANYPINFHCSIGKDRTGCLSYLIEGLMGFDIEVMYRDYMFTNFSNAGMCKLDDDILASTRYGYTLANYTGETMQEKVFNYLKDEIGVEESKLNHIIEILKEDNTDSLN